MESKLTLRIKKRSQPEFLIWLILVLPFLFGTLLDLFSLPSFLKYFLDVVWLFLFVLLSINSRRCFDIIKKNKILNIWILAFFLFSFIVYAFTYQSVWYYMWGVRNNFRCFVLFFACIMFLKKEDIGDYLKIFDVLFWINAAVSFVQYFVLGINGDVLGGIFGTEVGCNRYTNLYFVIITVKSLIYYLNKKEKLWMLVVKVALMMIIAALAEIKFFYMEFILIVILSVLIADFSWKNLIVISGGLASAVLGAYLLSFLFPDSTGFLSIEGILDIAASDTGYTSSGDLNRLTAVPTISNDILTTIPKKLFGLGLGNCDLASYDFLSSPFYNQYAYLRYDWFSIAFMFLETGYIGLTFYFGFFILIFILAWKIVCKTVEDKIYRQMAMIVSVCCIMIIFYNASLRSESGYMAYFILALPFISAKESIN